MIAKIIRMHMKHCVTTGCGAYVAVPTFKLTTDHPHDFNATVGDDVVFQCNAYAIPEASVVWYKNGEPIDRKSKCTLISAGAVRSF